MNVRHVQDAYHAAYDNVHRRQGQSRKAASAVKRHMGRTMSRSYSRTTHLKVSAERAWEWHARPGALERLIPPWEAVRVLERRGTIRDGDRTVLAVSVGPFSLRWTAEHRDCEEGRGFTDFQVSGPFASWTHEHRFEPRDDSGCRLTDHVRYEIPGGALAETVAGPLVEARLARTFAYRHRVTRIDLGLHERYFAGTSRRILVTGATGLVGSALTALLTTGGHRVVRLLRSPPREPGDSGAGHALWDPKKGTLDPADVSGFDVVVHLAGESIAAGRWTPERKRRIRDSRILGTSLLARSLASTPERPGVLVCASATGFYGDRGDLEVNEGSARGRGFLAETCEEWERAADPAREAGIRVAHLRTGIVLTPAGGALARMLPAFRAGLGGPMGSGKQLMSWITLDDLLGAILHIAATDGLRGPVNAVTPAAVRNAEFSQGLGRVLSRPAVLPVPKTALRALLGSEMADELLLSGARVVPRRLLETDYHFRYPVLDGALRHVLGRPLEEQS